MTTRNMFLKKVFSLLICFSIILSILFPARTKKVYAATKTVNILMIGNSLTYSSTKNNTSIKKLKALGLYSGYNFNIKYLAYGGEKLETYANTKKSRGRKAAKLINSRKWDIVILQQETDHAVKSGTSLKKAVATLSWRVRKKSPKARIILNSTWAYNKKKMGLSHSQQQSLMNTNYERAASAVSADIVYSGNAFDRYRVSDGRLKLYLSDKNHASDAGCYLNACCLYTKITGKKPIGNCFYGGFNKRDAKAMQQVGGYGLIGSTLYMKK